jgi:hypothetical protein
VPVKLWLVASCLNLALAALTAALAKRKGYSFVCWLVAGGIWVLALVVLAFLPFTRGPRASAENALWLRRRGNRLAAALGAVVVGLLAYAWAQHPVTAAVALVVTLLALFGYDSLTTGVGPREQFRGIGCRCRECGTRFEAEAHRRGERVKCPQCKFFVPVPR